mgnify:CR=1 FL=1
MYKPLRLHVCAAAVVGVHTAAARGRGFGQPKVFTGALELAAWAPLDLRNVGMRNGGGMAEGVRAFNEMRLIEEGRLLPA